MKKYQLILVVLVLVLSVVGVARSSSVWASPQSTAGENAPQLVIKTITENGLYNIGGVCTLDIEFKVPDVKIIADAEVPVRESKKVPFYGDGKLLYPGCHVVHYKKDTSGVEKIVNPMKTEDGKVKVCFGASPTMLMQIYYYLDSPANGNRVWLPLPSTLEDQGRLICAQALSTGVYMPVSKVIPRPGAEQAAGSDLFPHGVGGSVLPPPAKVTITGSGKYSVGGICTIEAQYKIKGLSDQVEVEYSKDHMTEETITVPPDAVAGIFYFPGCHVMHYRDQKIKDLMTSEEGDWQICFAAIPGKEMTIYYYQDNLTTITGPWIALETKTENGMACADLVDVTGVYTPVGK